MLYVFILTYFSTYRRGKIIVQNGDETEIWAELPEFNQSINQSIMIFRVA